MADTTVVKEFRWITMLLALSLVSACAAPGPRRTQSSLLVPTPADQTAAALAFVCRDLYPGTDPELSQASVSLWADREGFHIHYARDAYGRIRMDRNLRAVLADGHSIQTLGIQDEEPTRAIGDPVLTIRVTARPEGGSSVTLDAEDPEREVHTRVRELATALEALHEIRRRLAQDRGLQAVYLARSLTERRPRHAEDPVQIAVALLAAEAELEHGDPRRAGRWIEELERSGHHGSRARLLQRRCAELGAFAGRLEQARWDLALHATSPAERWSARARLSDRPARPEERVTDHLASNDREAALAWMQEWRREAGRTAPIGARLEDLERIAGDRRAALTAAIDRTGEQSVDARELASWVRDACACSDHEGALRLIARHGNWHSDAVLLGQLLEPLLERLDRSVVVSVISSERSVELYELLRHHEGFDDARVWRRTRSRLGYTRPRTRAITAPAATPPR